MTYPNEIRMYLQLKPSTWSGTNPDAVCPECTQLFRYAYKIPRHTNVYRIGGVPARSRLHAAEMIQGVQHPGMLVVFTGNADTLDKPTPPTAGGPTHAA